MTQQKIKTIFDDQKLKMTAKPIEQGARPPTFQLGTYRNNPQFTVYTNHDNGSGVTWMSAGMDMSTFNFVIELIRQLATNGPNGEVYEIENKRDIPKEKRTDPKVTKQVASKTLVGRDDDGKIWISVQDPNKPNAPKIRFYFGLNYYHSIRSKQSIDAGRISQIQATAWCDQSQLLMANLVMDNPNAAIDAANAQAGWQNKSGGNGGGNRGGNGGGGYNNNNNGGGNGGNKGGGATSGDGFGGDTFEDWD